MIMLLAYIISCIIGHALITFSESCAQSYVGPTHIEVEYEDMSQDSMTFILKGPDSIGGPHDRVPHIPITVSMWETACNSKPNFD